jgi:hypothetical protein
MESSCSFIITGLVECNVTATDAVIRYREKTPYWESAKSYFLPTDRRLRQEGLFHGMRWNVGRPRSVLRPNV